MMRLSFALCALMFSNAALAHGAGKMTGMWRVHQITEDGKSRSFPEALTDEAVVWGRQLWVFEETVVTLALQKAIRVQDETVEKGSKSSRTAEYVWCQAQATVPVNWVDGHDPALPSEVHIGGGAELRAGGNAPMGTACMLDLTLGDLTQVNNGPGAPKGATTLSNKDETFVVVLVPDGRPAELKDFLEGQTELR